MDGGVSEETIERCAEAGADVFVAGSAVYGADDPAAAVQALRAQAERATAAALGTADRPGEPVTQRPCRTAMLGWQRLSIPGRVVRRVR